jgi:hypothetical protein
VTGIRSCLFTSLAVSTVLIAGGQRVDAAIVFTLSPSAATIDAGTTGNYFDIFVQRTGGVPTTAINSYRVTLDLPVGTGVDFTSVTETGTGTAPYPFPGGAPPAPVETTTTEHSVTFSDAGAFTMFGSGQIYQLGRLFFDVDLFAPGGTFQVAFDQAPVTGTYVSNDGLPQNFEAATFNPTSISITPAAVPEPSSLALLACCGVGGLGWRWRKRRAEVAQV